MGAESVMGADKCNDGRCAEMSDVMPKPCVHMLEFSPHITV